MTQPGTPASATPPTTGSGPASNTRSFARRQPADHAAIWAEGHRRSAYLGQAGLLAWGIAVLDIALWDLDCRQSQLPLWRRIGPRRDSVPAYHSGGYLNASTDELVDEWACANERGFAAMKIRVGVGPVGMHRDRVRAVRKAMGDAPRLMVEASHSLDLEAATALALAIEPFDIHWLEEPFGDDDLTSYRELREATSIPLAMGEHGYYADGLREVIASGDIDIVQPDIIRVGGVSQWLIVAELAAESDRPIAPHFYREFDVPLACHAPTAVYVEHFDWLDRFFDWQVDLEAGRYRPREVPGFGLSLKKDVDAYLVAREAVRSAPR